MMTINHKKLLISLLGHCLILTLFIIKLNNNFEESQLGKPDPILESYLYQAVSQPVLQPQKQVATKGLAIKKPEKMVKINQPSSPAPAPAKGKPASELVALLHAAIQAEQHYPETALEMEREGNITLTFMLFPNGRIKDLKIIKPSGTPSLDEAALLAVNRAIPFKNVHQYLTKPAEYQITIKFELT